MKGREAYSGNQGTLSNLCTQFTVTTDTSHSCNHTIIKAPKVQMPRCSRMYASMQLADAYDSTYAWSR